MKELTTLLKDQPSGWPVWERGWNYGSDGRRFPSPTWHLFLHKKFRLGNYMPVAACHFRNGADFVDYDDAGELVNHDAHHLCLHCQEVEIQYQTVAIDFQ